MPVLLAAFKRLRRLYGPNLPILTVLLLCTALGSGISMSFFDFGSLVAKLWDGLKVCELYFVSASECKCLSRYSGLKGAASLQGIKNVRSLVAVGLPQLFNGEACFWRCRKFFCVQALIAEMAVEALSRTALPRKARFELGRANIDRLRELTDASCDKLGAIVTSSELWNAANRK
ncbi:hypothetical protein N9222_02170 [Pseudomonadales bacterium]|nr:hypothetical protein [Pseudomonadales bacterium]